MNKRPIQNLHNSFLIRYAFNKVYCSNKVSVAKKSECGIAQYLLTDSFDFDLPGLGTPKLQKNIILAAFKKNARLFTSSVNTGSGLFKEQGQHLSIDCDMQTAQMTYNCSSSRDNSPHMIGYTGRSTSGLAAAYEFNLIKTGVTRDTLRATPALYKRLFLKGAINQPHTRHNLGKTKVSKNTQPNVLKAGGLIGSEFMRAGWVLEKIIWELRQSEKKTPRPVINQYINSIRMLMASMGSMCPVRGLRIIITGRLGSRKKAMAQQISKCVGKVPLNTLRQNVDYSQGFLTTRFGVMGIKVWVCYGL